MPREGRIGRWCIPASWPSYSGTWSSPWWPVGVLKALPSVTAVPMGQVVSGKVNCIYLEAREEHRFLNFHMKLNFHSFKREKLFKFQLQGLIKVGFTRGEFRIFTIYIWFRPTILATFRVVE